MAEAVSRIHGSGADMGMSQTAASMPAAAHGIEAGRRDQVRVRGGRAVVLGVQKPDGPAGHDHDVDVGPAGGVPRVPTGEEDVRVPYAHGGEHAGHGVLPRHPGGHVVPVHAVGDGGGLQSRGRPAVDVGSGEPGGERRVAHAVGHGLRSAGRGERLHWPLRRPNVRWGGVGGGHEGGGRQGQQQDADRGGQPTAGDEDEKQAGEPVSSGAKVQAERKDDPLEHVRSYASTEDAVKRLSGQSGPEGHGCRQ